MTKPTAKDFEGALDVGIGACEHLDSHLHECGLPNEAEEYNNAAALIRRLLDSGFLGAALEYVAWCETSSRELAETDTSKAFAWINQLGERQHALRLAHRRLTAEPSEGGGE